jgi:hypothetical protein
MQKGKLFSQIFRVLFDKQCSNALTEGLSEIFAKKQLNTSDNFLE